MTPESATAWLIIKYDELGLPPFPDWGFIYDLLKDEIEWMERKN